MNSKLLDFVDKLLEAEQKGFGIEYQSVIREWDSLTRSEQDEVAGFLGR